MASYITTCTEIFISELINLIITLKHTLASYCITAHLDANARETAVVCYVCLEKDMYVHIYGYIIMFIT